MCIIIWVLMKICSGIVCGLLNRLRPTWWIVLQRNADHLSQIYISPLADFFFKIFICRCFSNNQHPPQEAQKDDETFPRQQNHNREIISMINFTDIPLTDAHPPLPNHSTSTSITNFNCRYAKRPAPPPPPPPHLVNSTSANSRRAASSAGGI